MPRKTPTEMRQSRFDSGYCMGSSCKTFVRDGDGNQWVEADESVTRLCNRCDRNRMAAADDVLAKPVQSEIQFGE